jgi:hypothetical protein
MLAYPEIIEEEANGKSTVTASLEWIEMLVDTCFVATTRHLKHEASQKLL